MIYLLNQCADIKTSYFLHNTSTFKVTEYIERTPQFWLSLIPLDKLISPSFHKELLYRCFGRLNLRREDLVSMKRYTENGHFGFLFCLDLYLIKKQSSRTKLVEIWPPFCSCFGFSPCSNQLISKVSGSFCFAASTIPSARYVLYKKLLKRII
uniref:UDP-glucuronate:xylan alpha-glucuronosyltransferase 2 n=1 Tax=Anthurium amnicola TaxID=1678845 RepID=A0A1D1YJV8_9ARAE